MILEPRLMQLNFSQFIIISIQFYLFVIFKQFFKRLIFVQRSLRLSY